MRFGRRWSTCTRMSTPDINARQGANSRQSQIGKLLLQRLDEVGTDVVGEIKGLVVITLLNTGITPDGGHVDHAVAELDERSTLDGNVEVGDVVQDEADEALVVVLADPLDEAVARERLAHTVSREPILRKAKVEERGDGDGRSAELFLLLSEVGAADEANGDLVAKLRQELQHFRCHALQGMALVNVQVCERRMAAAHSSGWGEGAIDVEKADSVLDRSLSQARHDTGCDGGPRHFVS